MIEEKNTVAFTLNGEKTTTDASDGKSLLNFLRNDLNMRGAKEGCRVGYCGACTVLLDGEAVHSCCVLTAQLDGKTVETIESASPDIEALRDAFLSRNAAQCGVCIPGMIMTGASVVRSANGDLEERHEAAYNLLTGNICRCGGYSRIWGAILDVLEARAL